MTAYVVAGIVLGGVYAISALGLVLTFASSKVFNFAHGAMAFFVARTFYELHTERGWAVLPSAVVALGIVAPGLGLGLWGLLFRRLTHAPAEVRLVSTVGLAVALPAVTLWLFGDEPIFRAPGLAGASPSVHEILGVRLNTDQIVVILASVAVAIASTAILRATPFGLAVRATVDAEPLASLVGLNPSLVSAGSWALGGTLAGLAGVLVAPLIGLGPGNFFLLVVASFAAVVAARFRSLVGAFAAAMALGVIQGVSVKYLPTEGIFSRGIRPSLPFAFMVAFLVTYAFRGGSLGAASNLAASWGSRDTIPARAATRGHSNTRWRRLAPTLVGAAGLVALPLVLDDFWMGILAGGVALAVVLLSYVVVTGEAGIISLCQITFAGVGALACAQLATVHHWPLVPALVVGAATAVPFGLLLALPALRLGELYLALATLAFALLMDNLPFQADRFAKFGLGVDVFRPALGTFTFESGSRLYYGFLVAFALATLLVWNLRRSTRGLTLAAVRSSEPAVATLGLSVLGARLTAFGVSSFIAGLGGGLLAVHQEIANPASFGAFGGIVLLAIAVTFGIRSPAGALLGGLAFEAARQLVGDHLPDQTQLVPVLFGLLAIALAREPRGLVAQVTGTALRVGRAVNRRAAPEPTGPPVGMTP